MGQYVNFDIVTRLECLSAGQEPRRLPVRTTRSPRRRLTVVTKAMVAEMVAARTAGTEINELAARFGINRNTVMTHLQRAGVPKQRRRGRTLDAEQLRAAGRLYESGVSLVSVGERFGVDKRYLSRALAEVGVVIRPSGRRGT